MEAQPDGHRILRSLVGLLARSRSDVQGDRYQAGALVRGAIERQASCAAQLHFAYLEPDTLQEGAARRGQAAAAAEEGQVRRPGRVAGKKIRGGALLKPVAGAQ